MNATMQQIVKAKLLEYARVLETNPISHRNIRRIFANTGGNHPVTHYDMPIEDVIERIPSDKLSQAMDLFERSLERREKDEADGQRCFAAVRSEGEGVG